jgi:predicted nucleic acid-binding protein
MEEVSATDAARGFSAMLDAVRTLRETFVVTRGGALARLILDTTVLVAAQRDRKRLHGPVADDQHDRARRPRSGASTRRAPPHVRSTGRPREAHDLIIAATAKATSRIVVSADATAFTDPPEVPHRP